jgi:LysM repeat protein
MRFVLKVLVLLQLGHGSATSFQNCDLASLNTTRDTYQIQPDDTIFTIARTTKRGICDIARENRMADAEMFNAGQVLLIPGQVCNPDNNSCLLVNQNATATCILGGPHTMTVAKGDTIEKIALAKLNITIASLLSNLRGPSMGNITAQTVLPIGRMIKIPQCYPSQCIVQPYRHVYGTYKDLAAKVGSTVGQIFAFNPGYNYSHATPGDGPVLTIPMNCTKLSDRITTI